ncbi:MAG TPA: hypothetical protein VLK23_18020, partial [Thermodesulfobacteriota bacterium]|nr:hypothetical protein [Thermodesulfobacteriota bacterium]
MEDNQAVSYVRSLERTIEIDQHFLEEAIEDFQEMCRIVSPDRNVPSGVIVDIRELYKNIQSRLTEIKAIQQLLKGKYHRLARRNPLQDKGILEMGFIAKTTFSRFENNLKMLVEKQKAKEKEEAIRATKREKIFHWFHSRENQVILLRNWRVLNELIYQTSPGKGMEERRSLAGERSLTLFLFRGDAPFL